LTAAVYQRPRDALTSNSAASTVGREGAALSEAERGMAEMSEKFRTTGGDIYVAECGRKREAID
jgi:hypothetical protein